MIRLELLKMGSKVPGLILTENKRVVSKTKSKPPQHFPERAS